MKKKLMSLGFEVAKRVVPQVPLLTMKDDADGEEKEVGVNAESARPELTPDAPANVKAAHEQEGAEKTPESTTSEVSESGGEDDVSSLMSDDAAVGFDE